MQTYNGSDTCNIRRRNLHIIPVEINIREEQSADTEMGHTREEVGYIVIESGEIG